MTSEHEASQGMTSTPVDALAWPSVMAAMSEVERSIAIAGGWSRGPSSLMEVLEIHRNEVANCKVARWLLDPLARHRLGDRMLRELARHVGLEESDTTGAGVEAEASRANTRADIVISNIGGTTVVVEAKVDAGESFSQGKRLEHDWPEAQVLVFLTVPGTRIPSTASDPARWVALSWRWLADTALAALEQSDNSDPSAVEPRAAVAVWANMIRRILV